MTARIITVSTKPGIRPAMNNFAIEVSVTTQYKTAARLGGIRLAIQPLTATEPHRSGALYPCRRISGIAVPPMAIMVDELEPLTVPNSAQVVVETIASPPRVRPNSLLRPSKASSPNPDFAMRLPMSMNSGNIDIEYFAVLPQALVAMN